MFFYQTKKNLERKEAELKQQEQKMNAFAKELNDVYQSQVDLSNLALEIGTRVTQASFVKEVEIQLNTKIGPVEVNLRVLIHPGTSSGATQHETKPEECETST